MEKSKLRIASWNMDHWKRTSAQRSRAWETLGSLQVDFLLAQEAVPPPSLRPDSVVHRRIGDTRAWGSAVISLMPELPVREVDVVRTKYGSRLFSMLGTYPGAVMVAAGALPDIGDITFVSVYGLFDSVYTQTSMLRIIADLIPLFDSPQGEHVILGGDFNISRATNKTSVEYRRYDAILHVVEALGLRSLCDTVHDRPARIADCPCGETGCSHLPTFRGGDGHGRPTQLDYLFATPALAECCTRLELPSEVTVDLSDHVPLIGTFDLSKRLPHTRWDTDMFVQLIAGRYGADAGSVVENLVDWARSRTAAISHSGQGRWRLDRCPISEGPDPELWFQLDRGGAEALQWTCSVRADGQVVMQFQYMRAPWDTVDGRREIWTRLAEAGLRVDDRLEGRPTLPLQELTGPDRTRRFIAILDSIVDNTISAAQ